MRWARFLQHGGWWPVEAGRSNAPAVTAAASPRWRLRRTRATRANIPISCICIMSVLLGDGQRRQPALAAGRARPDDHDFLADLGRDQSRTAHELGVKITATSCEITSPHGEIEAPVYVFPAIRPDTVAIPIGQGHYRPGPLRAQSRRATRWTWSALETDASGNHLAWSNVRVKIRKTDDQRALAAARKHHRDRRRQCDPS